MTDARLTQNRKELLLTGMRAIGDRHFHGASSFIRLAGQQNAQGERMKNILCALFNGEIPGRTALGRFLKKLADANTQAGELKLLSEYDSHQKSYRFRVGHSDDATLDAADAAAKKAADERYDEARREFLAESRLQYSDVYAALEECVGRCGNEVAHDVLRQYGRVERLKELPRDRYAAVIKAARDAKKPVPPIIQIVPSNAADRSRAEALAASAAFDPPTATMTPPTPKAVQTGDPRDRIDYSSLRACRLLDCGDTSTPLHGFTVRRRWSPFD